MDIGQRLRNLRMQKQLTQEELGERTDLSKGYISQLEHNQSSPSMETFFHILAVLGETPAAFFKPETPTHQIVYHPTEQMTYDDENLGYQLKWLVPASNENALEPVTITLAPHGCFKSFEPSPAETFMMVQAGTLILHLGSQQYTATAGDTVYFHATKRHQIHNAGTGPCTFTLVTTESYL
ncbi:helix-turn-helix domain-containing protein [Lactiplantibacillus mudanjiangensis]|uniref:Transcription regulator [Lactobacillus plantarum JDM1] n=1 Tax=Lactiplantibacillus mudanjiangensis TaxID=1296538 RepID=A0A660E7U8_9LACO|nr:XRE family transcriptional regulator [Lactiplantibacillus mudanjiangensis]VDG21085.1 transcription regulator [Lactobacillus plantarum JDM1] [Lactiplantibacillus mudanjiangensis]VDG22982.1 transcription regulator [Lactobacillus plantarum JDM1] [Lactiplantibacillus mudanjiangensis]VDG29160.1 transcription regulator [Lactobacillus plantarum JDM1] [Lactiplantibacillus mudanjiangensis]VDG31680.1 transcription regulator [Lactobacillus plantarum JDM1] [Lactiplantibacillus mudanjiangensis]